MGRPPSVMAPAFSASFIRGVLVGLYTMSQTKEFKGMKIPVTVSVDSDTKKWEIKVGIPSAAALLLKEAGIQKGSATSGSEWIGDITADIIKLNWNHPMLVL